MLSRIEPCPRRRTPHEIFRPDDLLERESAAIREIHGISANTTSRAGSAILKTTYFREWAFVFEGLLDTIDRPYFMRVVHRCRYIKVLTSILEIHVSPIIDLSHMAIFAFVVLHWN
jgi:hypothetical protein